MLPQSNATLNAVRRGGTSQDYGTDAADGPVVLTGPVPVYAYERNERRRVGDILDRVEVRYVLVDPLVDFRTGDTLEYDRGGVSIKATVNAVRNSQVSALPPQPVRLEVA